MFWTIMWKYFTPATLVFILIFNIVEHSQAKGTNYPPWAIGVGWTIVFIPIATILVLMVIKLCSVPKGSLGHRVAVTMRPTEGWGPAQTQQSLRPDNVDENGSINGGIGRENSFDNPSFNVTYTFETTI